MKKDISKQGLSVFEQLKQTDEQGNEFWSARDLGRVLEYSEYRHFIPVIACAKEACENSGQRVADHFEGILEMVSIGSGAQRGTEDEKRVFLRNEMAKHNTYLAAAAKNAGVVNSLDYAIFQNLAMKRNC